MQVLRAARLVSVQVKNECERSVARVATVEVKDK